MIGYIARRNVSFKMTDVIQLTHDAIAAVTEDEWVSSCRHVEELERKYWDADIAAGFEVPISPRVNPLGKPGFIWVGF